jgi:hypothetical protein
MPNVEVKAFDHPSPASPPGRRFALPMDPHAGERGPYPAPGTRAILDSEEFFKKISKDLNKGLDMTPGPAAEWVK